MGARRSIALRRPVEGEYSSPMFNLRTYAQNFIRRRRLYYREDAEEIALNNLRMLKAATFLTLAILILFLFLSPVILPGWVPTFWHLLFVPTSGGMFLLSLWFGRKGAARRVSSTVLCAIYQTVMYISLILIDIPGSQHAPASFLPLLFIVMPTLFTLPFSLTYSLVGAAAVCFSALVLACKSPLLAQYDIFEMIVAIFFSISVEHLVVRLRIQAHRSSSEYKRLSTRDALSGVLNKKAFEAAASRYLDDNENAVCALAVIDLDNFKQINDTLGHLFGDAVLRRTGQSLQSLFRSSDLIGRFGGDEFVLFLRGAITESVLQNKFRQLSEKMADLSAPDHGLRITCSMGVVLVRQQQTSYEQLFQQADAALYQAKMRGKNTCVVTSYIQPV